MIERSGDALPTEFLSQKKRQYDVCANLSVFLPSFTGLAMGG